MAKVVVLKIGNGDFKQGYQVSLTIGEDGAYPFIELKGFLPPAPEILESYGDWQLRYHQNIGFRALSVIPGPTNISLNEDAFKAGQKLKYSMNKWLNSAELSHIREKLSQKLDISEEVRFIVQTDDIRLQQLPWHLWNFCEDFHQSEIALSLPKFDQVIRPLPENLREKIRILAIFGNRKKFANNVIEEIDTEKDWELLTTHLKDTELLRLDEPNLEDLYQQIRQQSPNILFYAGHSSSDADGTTGRIELNQQEEIAIHYLKPALKKAVQQGLRLAIFNSCQGLGIARELADLHIPQVIVMREIVPDNVAQKFLQYFLEAYTRDKMPFYRSVREARENLSWLEYKCPGATWLPVIFQNPAEVPLSWRELCTACVTSNSEKASEIPAKNTTSPIFLYRYLKFITTLSQEGIILMFRVIEQLKQWLSNSQRQNREQLEQRQNREQLQHDKPSDEELKINVCNQTKSVLQSQLDSLDQEATLSLWPPNGEYAAPVVINQPLTLDGRGATIWALAGPVLSIESHGVNLRNLRIEVTGCEVGGSSPEDCAIVVKSGQDLQVHNVEVRGTVMGLPDEEGEWKYPKLLHLGQLAPETEYNLLLRIIVPVACKIASDISGLEFEPHNLTKGANEIHLRIEKFPKNQDILIDGNIFLVSASLKRRITITAHIRSLPEDEFSPSQGSIVWQPEDFELIPTQQPENPENNDEQPTSPSQKRKPHKTLGDAFNSANPSNKSDNVPPISNLEKAQPINPLFTQKFSSSQSSNESNEILNQESTTHNTSPTDSQSLKRQIIRPNQISPLFGDNLKNKQPNE
jgi:CHAT domain